MALPSEEESLFRLLAALSTLVGLGLTVLATALDLDIPAALQALTLAESAAPKVKESRQRLLATLAAPTSKQ